MPYKLLTVDVWDTLLRRKVHPDGIKLAASRYIFQALSFKTKQLFRSQQEILQLRQAIERKSKKNKNYMMIFVVIFNL